MSTNNFNEVKEEVQNDLKNVKSVEDAFKLRWYYPAVTAVLLILLTTVLSTIAWWAVGLGVLATVIIGIYQSQGKPSPLNVAWYWILLPTVILGVLLSTSGLTGWIVLGLVIWTLIAVIIEKPWEEKKNPEN